MSDPVAFLRVDQLPSLSTVPDDALIPVWSAGGLYAAPRSSVGSGSSGGSGYNRVQLNGVDLAQHSTLNVTGLLSALDSGGKTVLTLTAIALASQVSGVLPIANGGTGLSVPGSTGQSLRYNAGGLLEAYTPSSGLNAPASPADNGKVATANGGNLVYSLLTGSNLAPTAAIAFTQLGSVNAARLLGRDSGSGTPVELAVGGGVEFTGSGGIQRSALTGAITAAAGSGATTLAAGIVGPANLANGTIKGQTAFWNGAAWELAGVATRATDLGDASVSLSVSADGNRAVMQPNTLTTTRALTLSLTGIDTTYGKDVYTIEKRDATANVLQVKNSLGTVIFSFPVSAKCLASFQIVGGEWQLASHLAII